jgi:hypothetical protein
MYLQDICLSATKEKDIEAKLKSVINDWSTQVLNFSNFKTKGELLLKGSLAQLEVAYFFHGSNKSALARKDPSSTHISLKASNLLPFVYSVAI